MASSQVPSLLYQSDNETYTSTQYSHSTFSSVIHRIFISLDKKSYREWYRDPSIWKPGSYVFGNM